ncbi:glutathione S-transferase [Mycena olivaceomarginata]|nr:glutathione S-transferase [Mycena olivaceomarginata]
MRSGCVSMPKRACEHSHHNYESQYARSRRANLPRATDNAILTVETHTEPQELIFYAGWFCPFVQRSWIVLEEKGIPCQYKEVNPYKKEKHFLDINPKGLVPTVEYHGKALYESLVLCEFFEDT